MTDTKHKTVRDIVHEQHIEPTRWDADTNHTDSVEISDLTDVAIEVWNQNCDKSAPEAMRAVVTALQATQSQQVEEAVRKERKASYEQGYLQGRYDERHGLERTKLEKAVTPNHQD